MRTDMVEGELERMKNKARAMKRPRRITVLHILLFCLYLCPQGMSQETTGHTPDRRVKLQVLGSGGPELDDGRASTGYLVWLDDKARVLVDAGPGVATNFDRSGASLTDLEGLLLSHLHVDHSADLAALVKGLFFSERERPLPILGPKGGRWFPSTEDFVQGFFSESQSIYPYLSDFLDTGHKPTLRARSVKSRWSAQLSQDLRVESRATNHGNVPALAWKVEIAGKRIVFSGDFSGHSGQLPSLAKDCDILVCHNAVGESATGLARRLHAPPSVIGQIAQESGAKRLILSHRMKRSPSEKETLRIIRQFYSGPVDFAQDLESFELD